MSKKKLKIGVLGTASIAVRSILPTIASLPYHFKISGIASRDFNKAKIVADLYQTMPYESYDSILESSVCDAIYIPLPNSLHYTWVKKALQNGLHVLVEKSMACDLTEVEELNALANKNNLVLIENFQFRFHSQLKQILSMYQEGLIGDLRCVRSSFGFPPFPDSGNIRYNYDLGGGALLDAGAYPIKISQIFLGYDLRVASASLSFDKQKKVDIWGGAHLKQKNGDLFSEIAFGFDHYYQCSLELWGNKGRIFTNRLFTAPETHVPEILLENQNGKQMIKGHPDHHFRNMLLHFHQLVSMGGDLTEEYKQNINQARLIAELKQKANE